MYTVHLGKMTSLQRWPVLDAVSHWRSHNQIWQSGDFFPPLKVSLSDEGCMALCCTVPDKLTM